MHLESIYIESKLSKFDLQISVFTYLLQCASAEKNHNLGIKMDVWLNKSGLGFFLHRTFPHSTFARLWFLSVTSANPWINKEFNKNCIYSAWHFCLSFPSSFFFIFLLPIFRTDTIPDSTKKPFSCQPACSLHSCYFSFTSATGTPCSFSTHFSLYHLSSFICCLLLPVTFSAVSEILRINVFMKEFLKFKFIRMVVKNQQQCTT